MSELLWFHAFSRDDINQKLHTLQVGRNGSSAGTDTKDSEKKLKIDGPCVYAYLGRTLEAFGNTAFALKQNSVIGKVSPFDTGGLLRKIKPVSEWEEDEKCEYLNNFSWDSSELKSLLNKYPSTAKERLQQYINAEQPKETGPHKCWSKSKKKADIWCVNNDWRAWTWEIRSKKGIDTGTNVELWSCPPEDYVALQEYAENSDDENVISFVVFLSEKYVRGGVSQLIKRASGL